MMKFWVSYQDDEVTYHHFYIETEDETPLIDGLDTILIGLARIIFPHCVILEIEEVKKYDAL